MIGAPNTQGQKYWVGIVQWAPDTSVSVKIADIFRNYIIDESMKWYLFGAKPVRKPMLTNCQLDPHDQTYSLICIMILDTSFTKMHLKASSAKCQPLYPG